MMSESEHVQRGLDRRQYRVVKLSNALLSVVCIVLIVAVGELFLLRTAGRSDVRRLACYTVRYSPDSDPTAKEIRQAYHCPPPRAAPAVSVRRPSGTAHASAPAASTGRESAPPAAGSPVMLNPRSASPGAPPTSVASSPPTTPLPHTPSGGPRPTASGLLGGLLCDPRLLPVCLR